MSPLRGGTLSLPKATAAAAQSLWGHLVPGEELQSWGCSSSPSAFPPSLSAHQLLDQSWKAGPLIWNVSVGWPLPAPLPTPQLVELQPGGGGEGEGPDVSAH